MSNPDGVPAFRLRLGRVAGVPVQIHYSWLVVAALLAWSLTGEFARRLGTQSAAATWGLAVSAVILFFGSVLLHELGHALAARRGGISVRSVTLFVFGGIARLEGEPRDAAAELRVAAAGPAVTLVLAVLFRAAGSGSILPAAPRALADYLALANVAVLFFNLVPALPLDGGRLLRAALWPWLGRERATAVASGAGRIFAGLLVAAGAVAVLGGAPVAGFWYVLIGWFLHHASSSAAEEARVQGELQALTVRDVMLRDPVTVQADVSLADAVTGCVLHTGFGGYPVMRSGVPVGLLRLKDLARIPAERQGRVTVQDLMVPLTADIAVGPGRPVLETLERMAHTGRMRLLVVEDGRLAGLLTLSALARQLRAREQLRPHPRAA